MKGLVACRDNLAFMREFPDQHFKLIVTSPPYNLGKSYEGKEPLDAYLDTQRAVIAECVRLLHPEGSLCWQVGNYVENGTIAPLDSLLYPVFLKHDLKLRNRIVWHFGHGLHCTKRLSGRYETINWWTKGDTYTWHLDPIRVPSKYPNKRHFKGPKQGELSCNPLGKNPSDVWIFPNVKSNHPEKTVHPCQFPVELVERLVLSMTDEGDRVFDPYVGVGSAVIAALMHGREGYGCDIMQEYVDIAEERITAWRAGTLVTREMGKRSTIRNCRTAATRRANNREVEPHGRRRGHGVPPSDSMGRHRGRSHRRRSADREGETVTRERPRRRYALQSEGHEQIITDCLQARGWQELKETSGMVQDNGGGGRSQRVVDFVKDKVGVEVQFGKYAFIAYDFVKFLAFYEEQRLNVGVEIMAMQSLQREMSSGVGTWESAMRVLKTRPRGHPPMPLVLVGIGV